MVTKRYTNTINLDLKFWVVKGRLTRNTSHNRCHLADMCTAFHKQLGNYMDYTDGRVDLFFQLSAS
jgi:hypothetical protein